VSGIGVYFGRFKKGDDPEEEREPDPDNEPKEYVLWRYKRAIRYRFILQGCNTAGTRSPQDESLEPSVD
jgi:hypothetical protein